MLLEIGFGGRWSEEVMLGETCLVCLMDYLSMCDLALEHVGQLESVESIYDEAEMDGFWYPYVTPRKLVKKDMVLGRLQDIDGTLSREYRAKFDGVIWYYTTTLGVGKGDSTPSLWTV